MHNTENKRIRIAPSVLAADFTALGAEARSLSTAGADMLHIDVMDGMFVSNITFGACVIKALKRVTRLPLDVHMMVEKPERYIDDMADAGADILTVHTEATPHIFNAILQIAGKGITPGVAINPGTPISAVECVLQNVGLVLVMTVNPGLGGQQVIPAALDKITVVRGMLDRIKSKALLQVDGGVTVENANEFIRRGADTLVSGTAILSTRDRKKTIEDMRRGNQRE
ncbi:MAG: ribulose-phosphate 3-epimerase [Clostridia bacterium]|nr:ribulose-phosphate 3-epimerase [Clostridia bacterium]